MQTLSLSAGHVAGGTDCVADQWVFRALLVFLFWLPLPLGSNRTFAVGILILAAVLLLAATCYAWRHVPDALLARIRPFRWPVALLGLFVIIPWVQLLPLPAGVLAAVSAQTVDVVDGVAPLRLTLDAQQTQLYAALSFAYWSIFIVVLLTVRNGRRLEHLAMLMVASGVFQAVLGVFLFSLGAKYSLFFSDVIHDNVKAAFVNRNSMAGYMELCLSVGIGLMIARLGNDSGRLRNWRSRVTVVIDFLLSEKMRLRLMLVIMVIALVLTRSRMGNTAFFAAMLIVGVLAIILSWRTAPKTIVLIASLVIIDVVVVGTWVGLEKVVNRVQETSFTMEGDGREESVELRQDAAVHALALVKDFPLFGTGAGTFYNAYLAYRTPREGYFDHAHNDYVEIAADFGLIGFGLLGTFVLLTAACAIRIMAKRRSSMPRGIAFGSLMAMVALMIHSSVDFNLQIPANAATLVVIMAMAWCAMALPRGGVPGR